METHRYRVDRYGGKKQQEECADPKVVEAIYRIERDNERASKLLKTIFAICDMAGFRVEGRIVLVDKRSGRVWK